MMIRLDPPITVLMAYLLIEQAIYRLSEDGGAPKVTHG